MERLPDARAIRDRLLDVADVTVWDSVFVLSRTTIAQLERVITLYDFAVFVFASDDTILNRGTVIGSPRDNVVLEFGMFVGKIGLERAFVAYNKSGNLGTPSDLDGVTYAIYEAERDDPEIAEKIVPACDDVRKIIQLMGRRTAWSKTYSCLETGNARRAADSLDGMLHDYGHESRPDRPGDSTTWQWSRSRLAENGGDCLIFGPYSRDLADAAKYEVSFRIRASGFSDYRANGNPPILRLDVAVCMPGYPVRAIAFRTLYAADLDLDGFHDHTLIIDQPLPNHGNWEYRVTAYDRDAETTERLQLADNIGKFERTAEVALYFESISVAKLPA